MQKLIKQIEDAWADAKYPGDEFIFTPDSYDDEDITDYFRDTTWKGHSVAELRAHCSAISSFFTPQAWLYWLPAYLIAAIEDPEELSQGIDSITTSLSNRYPDSKDRIALLNTAQKIALVHFYQYLLNVYSDGDLNRFPKEERDVLSYLTSCIKMS